MLSTVSLIDPTTLNPSFSGPDTSRMGRPAVILTRADQQTSVDQFQLLLANAKAYRLQMLALSKAAANFGYALEKIAHSKAAVMDPTNVGSSLQAAAGLHYLMSNHHQILSDTLYKQFEIPLLQHLDTHKANIEASEAQYERSMRDMSQKIKETEATSLQNGRKRQRDLLQFRQALTTLTMQVDELERIKLGYYFSNLESEQANLQLILQKTSTMVRAEVDIYERIANKGLNDLILEPMTTQGPDPYCTYPTTDEFSSIFSILPPTPIIPTSGASTATAPQADTIMSNFYGYHEANPFSTARHQTNTTLRDRHLFGEASSVESKESMMHKAVGQNVDMADNTASSSKAPVGTLSRVIGEASDPTGADLSKSTQLLQDAAPSTTTTPEKDVQTMAVQESLSESQPNGPTADVAIKDRSSAITHKEAQTANKCHPQDAEQKSDYFASTSHSQAIVESPSESHSTPPSSNGVNLRRGQQHHRRQTLTRNMDDSPRPASSPSEPSSSVQSYTLRSRSGSRSHLLLASTPESPPVRASIHISQDSELLNNRDFSFSYEPSELLEQRSHHEHRGLHLEREEFNAFDEMEEDPVLDGFRQRAHDHTSHLVHAIRHRSSQGQLSHSSSSNLSSLESSTSMPSSMPHARLMRTKSGRAEEEGELVGHIRELGRGFDDGIPAFFADEIEEQSSMVGHGSSSQGSLHGSHHGSTVQVDKGVDGQESDPDLGKQLKGSSQCLESVRMADGSSKNVSTVSLASLE